MKKTERKLKAMGTFYKSDQPSGFGIMWFDGDARRMLDVFENSYRKFKASPAKVQQEYLDKGAEVDLQRAMQINPIPRDGIIRENRLTDDEAWFMTLGPLTIYILEQERRIVSDEFNGCRFVYEE
jgi:hypothetical protein